MALRYLLESKTLQVTKRDFLFDGGSQIITVVDEAGRESRLVIVAKNRRSEASHFLGLYLHGEVELFPEFSGTLAEATLREALVAGRKADNKKNSGTSEALTTEVLRILDDAAPSTPPGPPGAVPSF